jgi:hypothetical protein
MYLGVLGLAPEDIASASQTPTPLDNTSSYIVPSQGALINQTSNECITEETNQLKYDQNIKAIARNPVRIESY